MGSHNNSMDHEERLKQNLEVLGVDSLSSLTLDELADGIDNKFPPTLNLSTKRLIHIYVAWLNERLTVIDNSDDEILRKELREWVQFLRQFPVDDRFLSSCFDTWASEHSKVDPTSSRRLGLARIALQDVLHPQGEENYGSPDHNGPSAPQNNYVDHPQGSNSHQHGSANNQDREPTGQGGDGAIDDLCGPMHPDRRRQSVGNNDAAEYHGGMHPDRLRLSLEDHEDEVEDEQPNQQPLSFLTGANYLVYLEQMKTSRRQGSEPRDSLNGLRSSKPSVGEKRKTESFSRENAKEDSGGHGPFVKQGNKASSFRPQKTAALPKMTQKYPYYCRRCDRTGHVIEDCPTNIDPDYDIVPADTYVCGYCGKRGHYATVCHKNPLENSIYQRRVRAGIYKLADLDEDQPFHDTERHKGGYGREYDRDFEQDHGRGRDRDYGLDRDRDYVRDYGWDHDRGHVRDYDQYDRGHSRAHDQDRVRDDKQRHHEHYDRRDERQPRERSRSRARSRNGRGHDDNKSRRSSSPVVAKRDRKRTRGHPRIDRYRSAKQDSRKSSKRSRSPRQGRHKAPRLSRSPLGAISNSKKASRAGQEVVTEVRDLERVKDKPQDNELEMLTQDDQPQDSFPSQEPVPVPRRALGLSKRSGILSYADDPEAEDTDVVMKESSDRLPFDGDPAWEVFNLPRDQFLVALDEMIGEIAETIPPSDDMVEEVTFDYDEQSELVNSLEPIEETQPTMKLTAASLGLLTATTSPEETPGDIVGLAKFKELSIKEKKEVTREESPPIVLGVSLRPDELKPSYKNQVMEWMKTCSRMNVWVHMIQRPRAIDFITFGPKVAGLAEAPDSDVVELSEFGDYDSGSEFEVKQNNAGSDAQQDITMDGDTVAMETEVNPTHTIEGVAENSSIMAATENHVMTQKVVVQGQGLTIPIIPVPEGHVMTEDIIAPEPEHHVAMSVSAQNPEVLDLTAAEDPEEVVGNDSLISVGTEDSSITEPGDQLMDDVDMLVPQDVAQDTTAQH